MTSLDKISHYILSKNKPILLFTSCIGLFLFGISKDYGMFWDNVLFAAKMGTHLYENNIFNWTIPNSFDPGHPPFLGFLLALSWKIFERNLFVSHLLMLPFTIGTLYQIIKILQFYFKKYVHQLFAFLFIIFDPTLSCQFLLVNSEVIIIFFFLLAYNGFISKKNILKFTGLFFLSIISFRSMMLFAGFFLFDILYQLLILKKQKSNIVNLTFLSNYFLASSPAITYIIWRLATKGWLQTHANSPWKSLWQIADVKIFIKNVIVLIHRYLDFGRVFIFIFLFFSMYFFGKKIWLQKRNKEFLLMALCAVFFIIIASLISTNHFGHRYFIVSYIFIFLLALSILFQFVKHKKIIYSLLIFGLITGNLWVYPRDISQGWDACLTHIPYYKQRKKAIVFLEHNNININEVATFFPNKNKIDYIELNNDYREFQEFNGTNKFVLYSSIFNLSDENLFLLDTKYNIVKKITTGNINTIIYTLK